MDNFVRTQLALMSPFLLRSLEFKSLLCNKKNIIKLISDFPLLFFLKEIKHPKIN